MPANPSPPAAEAAEWVHAAYGEDLYADLGLDLSDDGIAAIEAQKDFLLRHDFIEHDFDVSGWIARDPLDIAKRDG